MIEIHINFIVEKSSLQKHFFEISSQNILSL